LDADDAWHPEKLALQMRALTDNPGLGLVGTAILAWPAESWPVVEREAIPTPTIVPWRRLAVRNYFSASSIVARRSVLDRVGWFDTSLHGVEDHDLWIRIAEVSAVANLDLPLTGYRDVPGSLSKRAAKMEEGMWRIVRKLDERDAWKGQRFLRSKACSYVNHSCAYMYGAAGDLGMAVLRSVQSLLRYPLSFERDEMRTPLERAKRLAGLLLRVLRLR
jgi:hypothetical protein